MLDADPDCANFERSTTFTALLVNFLILLWIPFFLRVVLTTTLLDWPESNPLISTPDPPPVRVKASEVTVPIPPPV